jgi:ABC-type sugar transport system permease subunit
MNALLPAATKNQTPGVKTSTRFRPIDFRLTPYLFLLPTLGMLTAFSLVPLLYGFWMSLHSFRSLSGGRGNFLEVVIE